MRFFLNQSAKPRVSAIVPARNEQGCIASVVVGLLLQKWSTGEPVFDEVVVANNGSTDRTADIAASAGARVIWVPSEGYGQACWEGVQASSGDVLVFVDGDGAVDPSEAAPLISAIHAGADLVVGVRLAPDEGAMTSTQLFGNALACKLMRYVWGVPTRDLGPFRAIRRDAFNDLQMRDRGFGWTVEMQIRSQRLLHTVVQIPVSWRVRAAGKSKISGTLKGTMGAAIGILGMIARLWWQEWRRGKPVIPKKQSYPQ
jgi:glycosyltransferase involved in cell wall biosynthesis